MLPQLTKNDQGNIVLEENVKVVNYPVEWLWTFKFWVTQLNLYALSFIWQLISMICLMIELLLESSLFVCIS